MKIDIFVATHKKFHSPSLDSCYKVIQGGCAKYPLESDEYLRDDKGDNISLKKDNYNELTSLYWGWKNSNADIKGLCHYRRYFIYNHKILEEKTIIKILLNYDVIMPYPLIHLKNSNIKELLNGPLYRQDIEIVREAIQNIFPDYLYDYELVMQRKYACYRNMFISSDIIYNDYCEWLFTIFDYVEKKVSFSGYNEQEQRFFGFMGELLLNVWLHHSKKSVIFLDVKTLDDEINYSIKEIIKRFIVKFTANFYFNIIHRI